MAQAVLDIDPRGRPPEEVEKRKSTAAPSGTTLLGAAFRNSAAQYGKLLKAGASALKSAGGMATGLLSSSQAKAQGAPSEQLSGMATLAVQAAKVKSTDTPLQAAKKLLPKDMKLGPRTPLNVAITGKRGFATTRIPLDETKALAKFFDVKLNDIVLATCAGALRRLYASDKKILAKAMVGAVPVSLRAAGDTSANNQVSMMLINMATNVADPAKRVAAIYSASMQAKLLSGSMKGVASAMTSDLPTLGIPWLMSIITPLYKTAVGTNRIPVVANVVAPPPGCTTTFVLSTTAC